MQNVDGLSFLSRDDQDVPQHPSNSLCAIRLWKAPKFTLSVGRLCSRDGVELTRKSLGSFRQQEGRYLIVGAEGHAGRWGLFTLLRLSAAIRILKLLLNQPSRTSADVRANRQQRGDIKPKARPKRRHGATSSLYCSAQPGQAFSGDKSITKSYLWLPKSGAEQLNWGTCTTS